MDPTECKYNPEHWWVYPQADGKAIMGFTANVQWHIGKVLFVDLQPAGTEVEKGQKIGEIEGVKALLEIYSPLSLKIVEVNDALVTEANLVNEDPFGAGWLMKVDVMDLPQMDLLMSSEEYGKMVDNIMKENKG
jgi:glycine cleavage system H protein